MANATNLQPIIIKKVKKAAHAHHGGAWKIAYADFVTAMMAFFLLMWLISMTTPEQKEGLADYFAPASISRTTSGAGGVMGGTAFDTEGARMPGSAPKPVITETTPPSAQGKDADAAAAEAASLAQSRDAQNFRSAAESLRQAMQENPDLAALSRNVIVDETPEGLRIQIVDQDGRAMFPEGQAEPFDRTRRLLDAVARILTKLPNRVSISGHTDATSFKGGQYTNWDLTSDRANAVRRVLEQNGLTNDRVYQVVGKADSEPLFPENPKMAANRRISIVLLREAPVTPPGFMP
jgi:chemotaxis protein MotB